MRKVVSKIPVGRVPVQPLGRREPTVVRDGAPFQAAPLSAERMQHLVSGLAPARIEGGPPFSARLRMEPANLSGTINSWVRGEAIAGFLHRRPGRRGSQDMGVLGGVKGTLASSPASPPLTPPARSRRAAGMAARPRTAPRTSLEADAQREKGST